jgi:hypothetical protein
MPFEKFVRWRIKEMTNLLEYLIKLKADAGSVHQTSSEAEEQLDRVGRHAETTGSRIRQAFSFNGLKSSLMSMPGMQFLMNPYTMIGAGLAAITKVGMQTEKAATSFSVLVGNEKKAAELLGSIYKMSGSEVPFSKLQLEKNSQLLMNFGINANDVIKDLKELSAVSGGDAERMSSLSLVFGQVKANGHLMGQDLLQFVNAGFSPLQELSAMTGESKGQITFENVQQAIEHATSAGGRFYGMNEKIAQTLQGRFGKVLSNLQIKMSTVYEKIEPTLIAILDVANSIITPIGDALIRVFSIVGTGIGWIVEYKKELAVFAGVVGIMVAVTRAWAIVGAVWTAVTQGCIVVQTLFNAVLAISPIGWICIGIGLLTAGVLVCWHKFAGFRAFLLTCWDVIKGLGNIIKTFLIDRLRDFLSGIGSLGTALKKFFSGDFSGAAQSAWNGIKQITGVNALQNAWTGTKNLVSSSWNRTLIEQNKKQQSSEKSKIAVPGLRGSSTSGISFGEGGGKLGRKKNGGGSGKGGKAAEDIATGGTRSTAITLNISKFFDNINVNMMDKADTGQLEEIVLQCLNRCLSIATSQAR